MITEAEKANFESLLSQLSNPELHPLIMGFVEKLLKENKDLKEQNSKLETTVYAKDKEINKAKEQVIDVQQELEEAGEDIETNLADAPGRSQYPTRIISPAQNNIDITIYEMFSELMEKYNMGMVSFEDMEKRLKVE